MSIKKRRISNPLKKFWKNAPKKVNSKNVTEICTFFTFTHVGQICFADNSFLLHFLTTFNEFEISMKFSIF